MLEYIQINIHVSTVSSFIFYISNTLNNEYNSFILWKYIVPRINTVCLISNLESHLLITSVLVSESKIETLFLSIFQLNQNAVTNLMLFSDFHQQLAWTHRSMFMLLTIKDCWLSVSPRGGTHSPKWSGETAGERKFHILQYHTHRMEPNYFTWRWLFFSRTNHRTV